MAMVSGGELVLRTLLQAGVGRIFALYGGHLETLFQACRDHAVPVLDVRHEVSAGHAAEGYARATRGLGVAFVTAGPGFTNAITSIANAYLDRTPVLYICASAPLGSAGTNIVQGGIDQVAIARPITKWAERVTAPQDIPRLVAQAIRAAMSAPFGPVLLDIPVDVSLVPVDDSTIVIPRTIVPESRMPPRPEPLKEALALLSAAKRPVILAGEGAWYAKAVDELRRFVEATGIPVFTDYQAFGILPSAHPLNGGTFFKLIEFAKPEARPDVVLALGTRFGTFTLGRSDRLIPHAAKVIHVDVDPKEIGRLRDVTVPIAADAREVLLAFCRDKNNYRWGDLAPWQRMVQQAKELRPKHFAEALARSMPPIHPYQAARAIAESAPADSIFIGDGAESHHWLIEALQVDNEGRLFTHGLLGATGCGTGLALGVQLAHPGKRVICVTGDGAIGFTIAEFDTMVRHNLPIVFVVMNNRAWGATRHWQEMISGHNRYIATALGDARYEQVAAGFGAHAEYVGDVKDLKRALKAAIDSGKPACVNVEIEFSAMPPESEALGLAADA